MKCWNCNHALREKDRYCANCGVDMVRVRKKEEDRVLCEGCGKAVPLAEADALDGRMLCDRCALQKREIKDRSEKRKTREQHMLRTTGMRCRRKAERFEVAQSFVRVAPMGVTAMLLRQDKLRVGPVVDLSRIGLQCVSEGRFEAGDIIRVEILAPAFAKPLHLRATVRWTRPESGGRTRMGVEFDKADDKTQAHLEALERHETLRNAAYLLEEKKKKSTTSIAKVETPPPDPAADF
jgi:hypothetical protein